MAKVKSIEDIRKELLKLSGWKSKVNTIVISDPVVAKALLKLWRESGSN